MTIGFYWFAFGFMPNFFVSYVLYELFHDIQYFAIVWLSGRSRVQREGTTSWMRSMFQPGLSRAFLFVAVMVAFGAGSREWFGDDQIGNVMKGVVIAAALLHYYYDGFIWRVRESDTRADLGIVGGAAGRVRGGLGHVVAWGFLFVALVLLKARSSTEFSPMERARMGIGAAPESFETRACMHTPWSRPATSRTDLPPTRSLSRSTPGRRGRSSTTLRLSSTAEG
jgi:hypothetical protein